VNHLEFDAFATHFLRFALPALTAYQNNPNHDRLPDVPVEMAHCQLWHFFIEQCDEKA
jgi:hypothetical protein